MTETRSNNFTCLMDNQGVSPAVITHEAGFLFKGNMSDYQSLMAAHKILTKLSVKLIAKSYGAGCVLSDDGKAGLKIAETLHQLDKVADMLTGQAN